MARCSRRQRVPGGCGGRGLTPGGAVMAVPSPRCRRVCGWHGPITRWVPNPRGRLPLMAPRPLGPQVDLAVLEVGIGGAYDCTNIIR